MEKVSLLVRNANVFNSYLKKFVTADVYIQNKRFYYIDRECAGEVSARKIIDADGLYMLPGLIDIHMHIESSMMTPGTFGRCLAGYGVTTIVAEPHEMANVKGIRGILEMIRTGEDSPVDIYYGIPSSVPSTSEQLETTGGSICCGEMKHLLNEKDVICVGEIMNYRQIIRKNSLEITKFLDYLEQELPGYVIEGHCPVLTEEELAKFLYLGIDSDHTEHTFEEFRQRIENGMFMELQDKMLRKEILDYIRENQMYEQCCFVTDDTMADVLWKEGHLNRVVQRAVEQGFPLEQAIYCATYTPSRRMHLYDRGAIAPGKLADFMLVRDPAKLVPELVYKEGLEIFRQTDKCREAPPDSFPEDFCHSVQIPNLTEKDFQMPVSRFGKETLHSQVTVRAIEVLPDTTRTREKLVTMPVKNGYIDWKKSGCLLAMVLERYGKNGHIGYGFVTGSFLKKGTAATTYFHDHHNLFVAGDNEHDMEMAVRRICEMQGGFLTVQNGEIKAELPLPIGGILSDKPLEEIGIRLQHIRENLITLGYEHYNPIMSLSTLGLPVSPSIKLTDRGLIDVETSSVVDLIKDGC